MMMRSLRASLVGWPRFQIILHYSFIPQHESLNRSLDSRPNNLRHFLEVTIVEDVQTRIDMVRACNRPDGSIGVGCHQFGHCVLVESSVCLNVLDFSCAAGGKSSTSNCCILEAFNLQNVRNGPSIVLRVHYQKLPLNDRVSILNEETLPLLVLIHRIAFTYRRTFIDIGDLVGIYDHLFDLVITQCCLGVHEDSRIVDRID